jgi:hypothetical protein
MATGKASEVAFCVYKLGSKAMPNDVGANGQSVVTKKSGGKVITGPDVCKTPSPGGPVPIPYPNISLSSDLAKGSKSVQINGVPACLKGSNFSKSVGDQAGSLGGVISGKTGDKAEAINYSFDVKVEGKNLVRNLDMFQSNARNTPPGPIMQVPILFSSPFDDKEEKEELHSCKWKDCDKKHPEKIDYPNDGCVTRGKYTGKWKAPWDGGAGVTSNEIAIGHYETETGKAASLAEAKIFFGTGKYVTNNHHLIPVATMAKFPKLGHNAKLVGFDINNGKYGLCLPYFITDIFRHDLQSHKTNHPNYSKKVKDQLRVIEKQSVKYCKSGKQTDLVGDLDRFAQRLRRFVINWDSNWLLRKSAESDRVKSFKQAGLNPPK